MRSWAGSWRATAEGRHELGKDIRGSERQRDKSTQESPNYRQVTMEVQGGFPTKNWNQNVSAHGWRAHKVATARESAPLPTKLALCAKVKR